MKKGLMVLFLLAGTSLWAVDLVLEDFDGKVETRVGSVWKPLDIGSSVAEASTVRLTGDALAEFRSGTLRIHITKDGTYQLSALVEKARKAPAPTLFDVVAAKTDKLLGKGGRTGQVNAGVRAEKAGGAEVSWAEEDEPTAESGPAVPDPTELRLNKARDLSRKGRNASALREALGAQVGPGSPWYPAASLLIAQEALTVGDYDLVVTQSTLVRPAVDGETAQSLLFLEALARTGLGQSSEARLTLQAVVAAGADTPVGQQAERLLRR